MPATKKHAICDAICDIVATEFIAAEASSACLPTALIIYEAMKQFHIEAELMSGKIIAKNIPANPNHFWVEYDGKIYDPTPKIISMHITEKITIDDIKYYPCRPSLIDPEQKLMWAIFVDVRRNVKNVKEYFDNAPSKLKHIKMRIDAKINHSIK